MVVVPRIDLKLPQADLLALHATHTIHLGERGRGRERERERERERGRERERERVRERGKERVSEREREREKTTMVSGCNYYPIECTECFTSVHRYVPSRRL
jgi:hypothetical protein